jgi:hypothetical protein
MSTAPFTLFSLIIVAPLPCRRTALSHCCRLTSHSLVVARRRASALSLSSIVITLVALSC